MKLETDKDEGWSVIRNQLDDLAARVEKASDAFSHGRYAEAYKAFPYHHPVGANLEAFMNELDNK